MISGSRPPRNHVTGGTAGDAAHAAAAAMNRWQAPAWRDANERALMRVRESFWPASQAATASALAWLFAHRVLGHPQPFFAPIAAAISLSTSHTQRSRRIVQMVIGVLLGIGVAEVLVAVLGTSTVALGVVVLVTLLAALLVGGGFVGEGMMFVNQAAASAVLVVALRGHGIGAERAVDVLVGGAVALVVGVLLFPAAPLPRLYRAERGVLSSLAAALEAVAERLAGGAAMEAGWTLGTGSEIHERLGSLAAARATARVNVRVAPRRWKLRPIVEREDMRIARLDLLANAVLSLVRATTGALDDSEPVPAPLQQQIVRLAIILRRLAATPQPWPEPLLEEVDKIASAAIEHVQAQRVSRTPVIGSILRSTARDLRELITIDPPT
jgi:uncharacterized membrane protein YgaE (UPF0421/DUF939 family)